jgi:hypothetical protein
MVSAVKARPNHYEMLGLSPTASSDEIARAFAREIGMFRVRAMGGVAQVSIAYETLRDSAKRRAYDASLGLRPEPELPRAPAARPQFIGFTTARPVERLVADIEPTAAASITPEVRAEAPAEPRTASFIAGSLREPVQQTPQPQAKPSIEPEVSDDRPIYRAEKLRLADVEDRPIAWKRPAMVAGGLVAAVIGLGALAGWQAGNGDEAQQPEAALTAPLPPPTRAPVIASAPPAAPERRNVVAQAQPLPRPVAVAARVKRTPPSPEVKVAEEQAAAVAPPVDSAPEAATTEPAVAQAPAVATAASLPLPNAVIARTIQRIGYACGQVASSTASETPGVFTVTCTSGHSYQATPVRGRYHFRRVGGH